MANVTQSGLSEEGGAIYIDIPGEDKVLAVYVGEGFAPNGKIYFQTLQGSSSEWGVPLPWDINEVKGNGSGNPKLNAQACQRNSPADPLGAD